MAGGKGSRGRLGMPRGQAWDGKRDTAVGVEAVTVPAGARLHLTVCGAVQGVGFRPFVYQLATQLGLRGWVSNSPHGVRLEVEGPRSALDAFRTRLETGKPAHAVLQSIEATWLDPAGFTAFEIRASDVQGDGTAVILPDLATCDTCRHEIFDPANRRYRYPFTNCTHCGPRFSIVESLPYDRPRTSMRPFPMCFTCRTEYEDPADRRFHAQPNACPACGPQLELWDSQGRVLQQADAALRAAAAAIRRGEIVALKGLGGYQLLVDAQDEAAVRRLRQRKRREEKPFALMFPDLAAVRTVCEVSAAEAAALQSSAAPIVLLHRRRSIVPVTLLFYGRGLESLPLLGRDPARALAAGVAPGNPCLGVMLPYTPLHHLLMAELAFPVVATSGNRSDEPICIDESAALARLHGIADVFLVHNRPIVRHVDDSIVRVLCGREMVLRRARGFAPLPVRVRGATGVRLAAGSQQKNTVALAVGENAFLSQHIGDLDTPPAAAAFEAALAGLQQLYPGAPAEVVHDAHPDYHSSVHAQRLGIPAVAVQHHCAHVAACMAENDLQGPVLGVAWDGTGYGCDGSLWGGEFFRAAPDGFERVASLRPFRLPGGDRAAREPRRSLLGVLFEMFGPGPRFDAIVCGSDLFATTEWHVLEQMLDRRLNAPQTSSAGRLFDALAALVGLRGTATFEGQAAMELEFAAESVTRHVMWDAARTGVMPWNRRAVRRRDLHAVDPAYRMRLHPGPPADSGNRWAPHWILDWEPAVRAALEDRARNTTAGVIARRFHLALVDGIVQVAHAVGEERVVLSGGCFQNALLTTHAVQALGAAGFHPYWHQRVPPNDGGIALGQIAVAAARANGPRRAWTWERDAAVVGTDHGRKRDAAPGVGAACRTLALVRR